MKENSNQACKYDHEHVIIRLIRTIAPSLVAFANALIVLVDKEFSVWPTIWNFLVTLLLFTINPLPALTFTLSSLVGLAFIFLWIAVWTASWLLPVTVWPTEWLLASTTTYVLAKSILDLHWEPLLRHAAWLPVLCLWSVVNIFTRAVWWLLVTLRPTPGLLALTLA